ncbi:MAG: alpha/beta hydrolase [Ignavibacteria bacterium]
MRNAVAGFRWLILAMSLASAGCAESFYFYNPSHADYLTTQERLLPHEEVTFSSLDGTLLNGWFIPAQGARRGTVVHFHGNTKNISGHLRYVEWLPANGYDVFVFDYRGYGKSDGIPNQNGVHEDCVAALAYVRARPDVDPDRIIVFGQSLGGNYALTALAGSPQFRIRAAIIEGAFASHREIARDMVASYPVPQALRNLVVDGLIGNQHDAVDALGRLADTPLLLIHGTDDEVVPYRHLDLLRAVARGPLTVWAVPGSHHLETFVRQPGPWRKRLLEYIDGKMRERSGNTAAESTSRRLPLNGLRPAAASRQIEPESRVAETAAAQ